MFYIIWKLFSFSAKKHFFSIHGENPPGSCIMKILFHEVRHFSPNFHEFTGSKTIFAKNKSLFLAQKLERKKNLPKSVSGYIIRLKKNNK